MSDLLQKEKKKVLNLRIKQNIENKEWQKLITALPVAEEAKISTSLLRKAWIYGGEYLFEKKDWVNVITFYNKARSINPSTVVVFDKLIQAFNLFFEQFKDKFSKQDLKTLRDPLILMIDYHEINFPKHQPLIEIGKELIQKIDYKIKYVATDQVETVATFKVQQIYNAIYDDMTFEQLRSEFARIIEPTVRELLDKKEKETKKEKNKKSKMDKKKK
jgi:hypothetical protein